MLVAAALASLTRLFEQIVEGQDLFVQEPGPASLAVDLVGGRKTAKGANRLRIDFARGEHLPQLRDGQRSFAPSTEDLPEPGRGRHEVGVAGRDVL